VKNCTQHTPTRTKDSLAAPLRTEDTTKEGPSQHYGGGYQAKDAPSQKALICRCKASDEEQRIAGQHRPGNQTDKENGDN
jgi:hypothetical protein